MAFNTLDYLLWRGDLSFQVSPVNLVDQFIFSQLATPDYSDIVSSGKKEITVEEACEAYFETHSDDYKSIGVLQSRYVLTMFRELCRTERFRHAVLCGYGSRIRYEKEEQFAAVTIRLSDDLACISFRGTDDTLIGWKEDCNLAVMDKVPAQRDAAEYLKRAARNYPGKLMTVGHSKGGNLAIYAAASVDEEIRSRIVSTVSFDGPGFREDFLNSEGYLEIRDRVTTVLPQNSIVGILLNMAGKPCYVHSSMKGPLTHDGFNWDVLGTGFILEEGLDTISRNIKEIVAETLDGMSDREKEIFIDTLFAKMTDTGARSVTELTKLPVREKMKMLGTMKNDPCLSEFADKMIQVTKQTILPEKLLQLI